MILHYINHFLQYMGTKTKTLTEQIEIAVIVSIALKFIYEVYMIPFRIKKIVKKLDDILDNTAVVGMELSSYTNWRKNIMKMVKKSKEDK